ncbi:unnamed protein product [Paramecium primaurelia]|uniref:Uncharacterized protein n=1 Tax=Paramecium primaurelia TaxID=5886 RepID=A0A8S1JQ52_PARPR|nr:unnamed protein product [Paramecium primaurelia]
MICIKTFIIFEEHRLIKSNQDFFNILWKLRETEQKHVPTIFKVLIQTQSFSTMQLSEHPSPLSRFPSSQPSSCTYKPSPHNDIFQFHMYSICHYYNQCNMNRKQVYNQCKNLQLMYHHHIIHFQLSIHLHNMEHK